MNREEYIKGLRDIKEFLKEKVSLHGNDSEWSKDVEIIEKAIALAVGTTKDVEIRKRLKHLDKRITSLQVCILLLAVNITIALTGITFIVAVK